MESDCHGQELGIWATSVLDFDFDLDFDMDDPETRRVSSFKHLVDAVWMLSNVEPMQMHIYIFLSHRSRYAKSLICSTPEKKWKRELAKVRSWPT